MLSAMFKPLLKLVYQNQIKCVLNGQKETVKSTDRVNYTQLKTGTTVAGLFFHTLYFKEETVLSVFLS